MTEYIEMLTREEERALIMQAQGSGRDRALGKILSSYRPFIIARAKQFLSNDEFQKHGDDFIQAISEAMIRAVDTFNLEYKNGLVAHARFYIMEAVKATKYSLMDCKVPLVTTNPTLFNAFEQALHNAPEEAMDGNVMEALFNDVLKKINDAAEERARKSGKKSWRTINVSYKDFQEARIARQGAISLDAPLAFDSAVSMQDMIVSSDLSPEENMHDGEVSDFLYKTMLCCLNEREIDILLLHNLSHDTETLKEVADRHGVSRERIRQIEQRAYEKIRTYFRKEKIHVRELMPV